MEQKHRFTYNLTGDILGGTTAMLVALPSVIAYGLMSFAPLGPVYGSMAAAGSIMGTIVFALVAPFMGGKKGLISIPSAAAAAVLSVFVAELARKGSIPVEVIPVYATILTAFAGLIQFLIGNFGGGKFIKYIPYPVIAGYLSGVAVLLLMGQIPRFLGLPKGVSLATGLLEVQHWNWESIVIGAVTITGVVLSKKFFRKFPPAVTGLFTGVIAYFLLSLHDTSLLQLKNNPVVIGEIRASASGLASVVAERWSMFHLVTLDNFITLIVPGITLALLLSITTLNTCVVLDGITYTNHDPKRELVIQGVGNFMSSLVGGIPSSGVMTATTENINSGGKTEKSTFFFGVATLLVLLFLSRFLAWMPYPALAGILIVVALKMIDLKIFSMLKNKSTILDFIVIVAVVVAAANLDLIKAAGVGIAMAIFLFLREQMGVTVIRRKLFGNQIFSKKIRVATERKVLEDKGAQTIIIELQGQLFFGTTDQLYSKLEPFYETCKFIVLDMRRIQSVDYTAANMLKKILARVKEKQSNLIFTSIPLALPTGQNVKEYFANLGLVERGCLRYFDDLDGALLWIEEEILVAEHVNTFDASKALELGELELFEGLPDNAIKTLYECVEVRTFNPNETIFKGGDKGDEIYFVRQGNVKIVLSLADGKHFHLLTIGTGGVFGEMAFIDKITRSADAISVDHTNLFVLSRDKFNQVTAVHPAVSGMVFERLALLIANRLRQSNKELKVFQES